MLFSDNEDHFDAGNDRNYDVISRFEALSGSEAVLEVSLFFDTIAWSIYYHNNHIYGDNSQNN